MKQVFVLIIIILWGILQARRKAMREQQRKSAQQGSSRQGASRQGASRQDAIRQSSAPQTSSQGAVQQARTQQMRTQQTRAQQAAPLGAVTAQENQPSSLERGREDRSRISPETTPDEIRSMLEFARRSKQKEREAIQEEPVEEIVSPASSEQAYETTASVQCRIRLDPSALRMFVVTREVLGPPRFRKPHRPGNFGR